LENEVNNPAGVSYFILPFKSFFIKITILLFSLFSLGTLGLLMIPASQLISNAETTEALSSDYQDVKLQDEMIAEYDYQCGNCVIIEVTCQCAIQFEAQYCYNCPLFPPRDQYVDNLCQQACGKAIA